LGSFTGDLLQVKDRKRREEDEEWGPRGGKRIREEKKIELSLWWTWAL